MTIDGRRVVFWLCGGLLLVGIVLVAHGCTGANRLRHGDSIDVSSYPQDIQEAYDVFAVRCSRCHTLARPLNARIADAQHWVRYVTRMRRNPTSGINAKDADIILRFLLYYMHQKEKDESESEEPIAAPPAQVSQPVPAAPSAADEVGSSDPPIPAVAPEAKP